ncbi:MAG: PfkB family carbohydrate kinase [Bacteroidales bacterium]
MKERALHFETRNLRYTGLIGTGGIGNGKIFKLSGDHTLGREESRSGHFLDVKDYCKQHIILHYIKVLMGPGFTVIPLGKVGDDEMGNELLTEMKETGMDMTGVEKVPGVSTLFSFCFQYPDGSGGNLTTDYSASTLVDRSYIDQAGILLKKFGKKGVIMAAPEVPLAARKRLLHLGKQQGLFCSASFTSGEIRTGLDAGTIMNVDLIALNLDEASAIAGIAADQTDPASLVLSAVQKLRIHHQSILVSITAGNQGSWCWDGYQINRFPAIQADAINTAGAGDAFFSGILCGLALGLHLFEAQQLASLIAGLSVTSPHTIHKGIERNSLQQFMLESDRDFPAVIKELLAD